MEQLSRLTVFAALGALMFLAVDALWIAFFFNRPPDVSLSRVLEVIIQRHFPAACVFAGAAVLGALRFWRQLPMLTWRKTAFLGLGIAPVCAIMLISIGAAGKELFPGYPVHLLVALAIGSALMSFLGFRKQLAHGT